jgi:uncharacterized protein YidB (DUF937 family)
MALLDILGGQLFGGQQGGSGRVPPLAKGLAGLLAYSKLNNPGGQGAGGAGYSDQLEEYSKPSPTGGPTAKDVIDALLTGGMMDLVHQFRGAGKAQAVDSWIAARPNKAVSSSDLAKVLTEEQVAFLTQRTGLTRDELLAGLGGRSARSIDRRRTSLGNVPQLRAWPSIRPRSLPRRAARGGVPSSSLRSGPDCWQIQQNR